MGSNPTSRPTLVLSVTINLVKPILLCGIPASGKSSYGQWLQEMKNWRFLDIEEPGELERAGLRCAWDELFEDRPEPFIDALLHLGGPVAVAWGFPPDCIAFVRMLKLAGMEVWWFDGDRDAARRAFLARGSASIKDFDSQMQRIHENWISISDLFADRIILSVHAGPRFEPPEKILQRITT